MWALLRLWFQKGYWVQLGRRQFWRDTWRSLGRLHKDKRAWEQVSRAAMYVCALLVLVAGAMILGLATLPGMVDDGFTAFLGFTTAFSFAGFVVFALARSVAGFGKAADVPYFAPLKATVEVRHYLGELALVYAVLADRAGSESFLAVKTLPEGFEVTTRRVHMDVIHKYNLWNRLGGAERDLLLRPDGHWEPGVADQVLLLLEPLRMLRWVLRLDDFLPALGSTLNAEYRLAKDAVQRPERLFAGDALIGRHPLTVARETANSYFQRCAAEGVSRGFFTPESEANAEWSKGVAGRLRGKQSEDFLLDGEIVSEADERTIRLTTTLSLRRLNFCNRLVRLLDRQEAVPEGLTGGAAFTPFG